jgi:hypothetical protein
VATSPTERQSVLADLATLGIRDLVEVWRRATQTATDFAALILAAFPEIASGYAGMAADLAADWYSEAAPALAYAPTTAPAADVAALTQSTQWALGADGDEALNRMAGTMQRAVFNGARDTTLINVQHEKGAKWARYASANACEFCRLMAIRGAVFLSEKSGSFKAHDKCHCVAVEVRPGTSYEPPDYISDWDEQYTQARRNAPSGSAKAILAAWRQL